MSYESSKAEKESITSARYLLLIKTPGKNQEVAQWVERLWITHKSLGSELGTHINKCWVSVTDYL